ncbi:hypothetical protein RDI58_000841 [Solanum bulbocastanum]|uniref:Uncharacterized protein n=1 Tax=Solanum bulbocastanum TaxID=147425 RepID=A0AAN8YSR3_SOLBU
MISSPLHQSDPIPQTHTFNSISIEKQKNDPKSSNDAANLKSKPSPAIQQPRIQPHFGFLLVHSLFFGVHRKLPVLVGIILQLAAPKKLRMH